MLNLFFLYTKGSRQKKTVFFYFLSKGGRGGLGQSKKSLSENTQIFFDQGGGSHPIQKGFIRKTEIFWHNLPKKGAFIKKKLVFFDYFGEKGGGSRPIQKISVFLFKVKKTVFFMAPLIIGVKQYVRRRLPPSSSSLPLMFLIPMVGFSGRSIPESIHSVLYDMLHQS